MYNESAMTQPLTQLFLGFEPEPSWTQAFVGYRPRVETALQDFTYRWVPPANYHMTLHYFGACTRVQKKHLLAAFSHLPWEHDIILRPTMWSLMGQRSPRSLTIEFGIDLQHPFLKTTQAWVAEQAQQSFMPNAFRPHVTFGKHKGRVEASAQITLEGILATVPLFDQPTTISRCALFETRIADGRASYIPLVWT